MTVPNGEFGGVVVRSLKTAGRIMQPGEEIPPEMAMGWPLVNRVALGNSGQIRWHTRAEDAVREEEKPRRGRPPKTVENDNE